jgi:tetratricopeptide (TPR) repeat protein
MIRRARFCVAATLIVFASSAVAQALQQPNEIKAEIVEEVVPALNPDPSASATQKIDIDPLQRLALQIKNADYLRNRGDAGRSVEELRETYYAAMALVQRYPAGSDEQFKAIRQAEDSGGLYAWLLADDQQFEAAEEIYQELLEVLKPYDVAEPPSPMVFPLASTYWLGSRLATDRGNNEANFRLNRKVEQLTRNLDAYPGDFVDLAQLRVNFLRYDFGLKPDQARAQKTEACKLANDIDRVRSDSSSLRVMVACDLDSATFFRGEGKFKEAIKSVEAARSRIESRIKLDGETTPISVRFLLVDVELALRDIAVYQQSSVEQVRRQIAAAEAFISALQGRSYSQKSTDEISAVFSGFKDIDLTKIPELTTKSHRDAAAISLYSRIADAVETSRKAFPNLIGYALASGESLARVANLRLDAGDLSGADEASARAEAAMDDADLIAGLRQMNEIAESECLVRNRRIRVLISMGRTSNAVAAYRKFDQTCGEWVRKYPWEYYARQYLTDINWRLGSYLHSQKRYEEALPMLTYASDWGYGDASLFLADMYRTGHGVTADSRRAKQLLDLGPRQSLKRFTVPTDFAGIKHPFHVYIHEYGSAPRCNPQAAALDPKKLCAGYIGIDDQAIWVRELRGGEVPIDVITSFQKIYAIAKENNVSFLDLAVSALGGTKAVQAAKDTASAAASSKEAVAVASEPLTLATPNRTGNGLLFAVDVRSGTPKQAISTRIIPFIPDGVCVNYVVPVTKERRRVEIRQVVDYPQAPAEVPSEWVMGNNGRRGIYTKIVSLAEGMIHGGFCLSAGDPAGLHHIEVLGGNESLFSTSFDIVPNDGLFEWKAEIDRAEAEKAEADKAVVADISLFKSAVDGSNGPVELSEELLDEQGVLLLQGKNTENEQTYTYLQLSLRSLMLLREKMRKNENFEPESFGTVLVTGKGEPDAELRDRMAREHNMLDTSKPRPTD